MKDLLAEAYLRTRAGGDSWRVTRPLRAFLHDAEDCFLMLSKELIQVANRPRFHVEKAVLTAFLSGALVVTIFGVAGDRTVSIHNIDSFGREAFAVLSLLGWAALSLAALGSATGIILTEAMGKRLDLLRITPLSIETVIIGKGLAVMARCGLLFLLLVPLMGAAQMAGGVDADDLVKVCVVFASDIYFFTGLGLFVSAGARSSVDRVMRPFEALLVWTFAAGMACFPLAAVWPDDVLAILPFGAQSLLMKGDLAWTALVLHSIAWTMSGTVFLVLARRTLEGTIRRSHEEIEDPTVKDFLAFPAFVRWRRRHLGRFRVGLGDTLLAGQVSQTSMLTVAAPIAVLFTECLALVASFVSGSRAVHPAGDIVAVIAFSMPAAAAFMACVEACGVFAREKARHTAAVIASTPEGGPAMLLWKGGAVVYTQAVPIVISLVVLPIAAFQTQEPLVATAAGLLGFLGLALFLFAFGVSSSLVSKSPVSAAALVGLALLVVAPVCQYVFFRLAMESPASREWLRSAAGVGFLACLAPAAFRNLVPRFAAPVLCVSVGAASALWPFFIVGFVPHSLVPAQLLPLMSATLLVSSDPSGGAVIARGLECAAVQLVIGAVLLAGLPIKFSTLFLSDARGKD